jgi:hypothetical protein
LNPETPLGVPLNARSVYCHREVLKKENVLLGCYSVSTCKTVSDVSEEHAVSISSVYTVHKLFLDCYLSIDKANFSVNPP